MPRPRGSAAPLLLAVAACGGNIGAPSPSILPPGAQPPGGVTGTTGATGSTGATGPTGMTMTPRPDAGPPPCEPTATAVSKLLRVSNHEYRNMVQDLLGVPVDEALFSRWTPVAEVYGFDTMSETRIDAQGLEVQIETAERLAEIVLGTPALTAHCPAVAPAETPACELSASYSALENFSDTQGRECWTYLDSDGVPMIFDNTRNLWRKEPDQTVLLWANGAHPGQTVHAIRRWTAPVTGTLTLNGRFADADPGGGDGVLVSIKKNDADVFSRDLGNGDGTDFQLTMPLARGDRLDFVVDRKANPNWDTTGFTASLGYKPTPRKAAWSWANCAEPLITRLASRAFRRPARAAEIADYQALWRTSFSGADQAGFAEPAEEALKAVLQAVFLSPNFVFKPELVPNGMDASEHDYAVAARLSLFVRGSLPDDVLWQTAGAGGLATPAAVRAQVERLLTQDISRFATNFGGQWLAFRDPVINPGPLAAPMQRESLAVFQAVLAENLLPEDLLSPGFTIVDEPLAAHYRLTPPSMTRAPYRITTTDRGGLLSQGSFLTRTGGGSEFRRPIHRGIWVLTRLLCRTLPRLDPATREEIGNSFMMIDQSLPLPQQMAIHRQTSSRCPACHGNIDPVGLALEKYDELAQWRETYPSGAPIVSNLDLFGTIVRDPRELAAVIEDSPEFRDCVATKLLTFALNRGPLDGEQCVARRIAHPLDGSKPTLKTMTIDALVKGMELTEAAR